MKATHMRAHISPRKTRLVADMVRGQSVARAKDILDFSDKRAAVLVAKVVRSAEANAIHANARKKPDQVEIDIDRLVVQRIQVNEGPRWKVLFPRPRGVGATMTRPTCHIEVELAEAAPAAPAGSPNPRRKQSKAPAPSPTLSSPAPSPPSPDPSPSVEGT